MQGLTLDFGNPLPRGQAWHNFNMPYCLSTCLVIQTYIHCMYVVQEEMLKPMQKQTTLTIYCAIIKDVNIQKYLLCFSL